MGADDAACVLAIDLGTGGPKVAVVDAAGATLAWSAQPVHTAHIGSDGAEQDPQEMWSATVVATHRTLAAWAGDPRRIEAVAVTSQYMSTIPVTAEGMPTGPCIMWMDGRGGLDNLALLNDDSFMLWVARHGLIPLPSGNDGLGHIAVLRRFHPDAYASAAAFVEPMDYLVARLTARVSATQSTAWSLLCCDNRTWGAIEYDAELVAAAGVDPAKLPPLRPMHGWAGELTEAAAIELGLPSGIPIAPGTIDSITSAVGTGALGPDTGAVVVGTTAVVVTHVLDQRGDIGAGLLAVPSPLPGRWYVMAENGVGGRALEWFLRSVVYPDDALTTGATLPADAWERAERAAASVPAGSSGVQFLPWLLGSIAPAPSDDVRAAFVGLGLQHTRAHLVRAVMEGVALNVAWLVPFVEAFVGGAFSFVRFGGGAALSPVWAQALADALDKPVYRLADPRATNCRGAAFLALAELGHLCIDDVAGLLRVDEVHQPEPKAAAVMAEALGRHVALHPPLAGLAGGLMLDAAEDASRAHTDAEIEGG